MKRREDEGRRAREQREKATRVRVDKISSTETTGCEPVYRLIEYSADFLQRFLGLALPCSAQSLRRFVGLTLPWATDSLNRLLATALPFLSRFQNGSAGPSAAFQH